jgi:hypothetical protein
MSDFNLEENFDDDFAKAVLSVQIDDIDLNLDVAKSLYKFDVDSKEGLMRLLELLPILDRDILFSVYGKLFPTYQTEKLVPRMVRSELKGFLMDYLALYEQGVE